LARRAWDEREPTFILHARYFPEYRTLRSDPRFAAIVREMDEPWSDGGGGLRRSDRSTPLVRSAYVASDWGEASPEPKSRPFPETSAAAAKVEIIARLGSINTSGMSCA
jgi:hypothetical protein